MKTAAILALSLFASALGTTVPRAAKVDYAGYQSLRITLPETAGGLEEKIEDIAAHILNPGHKTHIDVVVPADKVEAIKSLTPDVETLVEDVGAALAEEGDLITSAAGKDALRPYLSR